MTLASIFLGTVIASIFGCAFHFWRGGGLKWLVLFNFFAWIGFWAGHLLGSLFNIRFFMLEHLFICFKGFIKHPKLEIAESLHVQ